MFSFFFIFLLFSCEFPLYSDEEAMQNITGGKRCTAERFEIREYDYAGILCNLNCRKVISSPALECLLLMGATLSQ